MPFDHVVDHVSRLVVARGTGEGSLEDVSDSARRLLEDPSIGTDYRLMIVADDTELDLTTEEALSIVSILGAVRSRFRSRIAIVTSRPDRITTAYLVAFAADRGSGNVQSFISEGEARAWLLATPL